MDIQFLKKYPTLSRCAEIEQICSPLKTLDIHHFHYLKNYDDGSQVNLCNEGHWIEHFFNKRYYENGFFEKHPCLYKSGIILWSTFNGQDIFNDGKNFFDIANGLTIVNKLKDSCEFYFFGASAENEFATPFYVNNLDLLKKFILYFKDRAWKIIKEHERKKLILPKDNNILDICFNKVSTKDQIRKKFLQSIKTNKRIIINNGKEIIIYGRELECLLQTAKGKQAKVIAKSMNISPRTVETYIERIKIKLGCKTKTALIEKLFNSNILQ